MKMIDLWRVLLDMKLKGSLSKSQFAKCVLYIAEESRPLAGKQVADDDDMVDYQSLCRYIVRMGRSYMNQQQDRQREDDRLYKMLLPELKRDLALMIPVAAPW